MNKSKRERERKSAEHGPVESKQICEVSERGIKKELFKALKSA